MTTYPIDVNVDATVGQIAKAQCREEVVTSTGETYPYTLPKLHLLGRITASGKVQKYRSDAADGSQVPMAVGLADVVFAATGDITTDVIVRGKFRLAQLTKDEGGALTKAEIDALHNVAIYVSDFTDYSKTQ